MQIPIENIYFLLCYAWDKLEEKEKVKADSEEFNNLLELLSRVLINGSKILLKRGLDHDYQGVTKERNGVKGKLEVSKTIKRNSMQCLRAVCSYDEYSANILNNQIVYTTLLKLLYSSDIEKSIKDDIRIIIRRFPQIEKINLTTFVFNQIKIHRNNQFYEFLLNVCQLIFENQLPSEEEGIWSFTDVTRDEKKMASLFEDFVHNFYKIECPEWDTSGEYINWNFETSGNSSRYLPRMETDITLRKPEEKIIIDTKFYKKTLRESYDTSKVKSENLYQLFSYLMHQENGRKEYTYFTKGILLYPTISKEYDLKYSYNNHPVEIRTVNLNQEWKDIMKRLKDIIKKQKDMEHRKKVSQRN